MINESDNHYHFTKLKEKRMNFSRQRECILNYLKSTTSHPTAEEIHQHLKQELPNLSLATVYRNCNKLAEMGQLLRLDTGEKTHFDANTCDHQHFVCTKCDRVYDMFFSLPAEVIKSNLPEGFSYKNHRLYFFGVCKKCI